MITYHINSPLNATERTNLNETLADIRSRLIFLQRQINIVSGGPSVEQIIQRIDDAINNANTTAAELMDLVNTVNDLIPTLQTALTDSTTATESSIEATTKANELIDSTVYKGEYSNTTVYEKNNIVYSQRNSYIYLNDTPSAGSPLPVTPALINDYWRVIALGGLDGMGSVVTVNDVSPDSNGNVELPVNTLTQFLELKTSVDELAISFNLHKEQVISVKDYGAKGDGITDDSASIQRAIDYAETVRGTVFLPQGNYLLGESLRVPSFIKITGASTVSTVLNNQFTPLNAPQIVNKNPDSLIYFELSNISLRGGTYGVKLDVNDETSGNKFSDVTFELQTVANFQVNKLLQTTSFENCIFGKSPYGLVVQEFTANANIFVNCSFIDHEWSHVTFESSEVNNFYGCRFEGEGQIGRATISLNDTRSILFDGCYFENTHEILINENNSHNAVVLQNCHFTGARNPNGGFIPYKFVSDGIIAFGTNTWGSKSDGPENMMANGLNGDKLGGNNNLIVASNLQNKHLISKSIPTPASLTKDLFSFTRDNDVGSLQNIQMLTGLLTINYFGLEDGGFEAYYSRRYHVIALSNGSGALKVDAVLDTSIDSPRNSTLTIRQKTGANRNSATLEAVFTGLNPVTEISSAFQYGLELTQLSTVTDEYIKVNIL